MYNQGKMGLMYSETQYADIHVKDFLLNPDIQEGSLGWRVCPDPAQGFCCVLLSITCTCSLFFALEFNAKLYRLYRNLDVPEVLIRKFARLLWILTMQDVQFSFFLMAN